MKKSNVLSMLTGVLSFTLFASVSGHAAPGDVRKALLTISKAVKAVDAEVNRSARPNLESPRSVENLVAVTVSLAEAASDIHLAQTIPISQYRANNPSRLSAAQINKFEGAVITWAEYLNSLPARTSVPSNPNNPSTRIWAAVYVFARSIYASHDEYSDKLLANVVALSNNSGDEFDASNTSNFFQIQDRLTAYANGQGFADTLNKYSETLSGRLSKERRAEVADELREYLNETRAKIEREIVLAGLDDENPPQSRSKENLGAFNHLAEIIFKRYRAYDSSVLKAIVETAPALRLFEQLKLDPNYEKVDAIIRENMCRESLKGAGRRLNAAAARGFYGT